MTNNCKIKATYIDSGETITLCDSLTEENAKLIKEALEKTATPFSKFEISEEKKKSESVLLCIDPNQLELAWVLQTWLKAKGVSCLICFSTIDFELIREVYVRVGSPHMIVKTGRHQKWDQLEYDLKLGDFDQDSFETIYDFLD